MMSSLIRPPGLKVNPPTVNPSGAGSTCTLLAAVPRSLRRRRARRRRSMLRRRGAALSRRTGLRAGRADREQKNCRDHEPCSTRSQRLSSHAWMAYALAQDVIADTSNVMRRSIQRDSDRECVPRFACSATAARKYRMLVYEECRHRAGRWCSSPNCLFWMHPSKTIASDAGRISPVA